MNSIKRIVVALFTFFLLLGGLNAVLAQTKADSLIALLPHQSDSIKVRTLNLLAVQFFQKDIVKSRQYADQALSIAQNINSARDEAEAAYNLCGIMTQQGQFAQALEMCRKAEAWYTKANSKTGLADVYNRTGMNYNLQGQYPQALDNFTRALRIREQLNAKDRIIPRLIENIGMVYFRQEDYKVALDYFKESYKSYQDLNDVASASKILVNMGAAYNRLKMPVQALEAHQQSLTFFEKINDAIGMGIANNNIGNVYKETKEYTKAIAYYEKSLALKQKMNDKRGVAVSLKNIAETYLNLNDLEKAKDNIDRSLKIAEEIGSKEQIKDAYDILAQMYEKTKDYKKALSFEKKMSQSKDSLFSSYKTEQISRMRAVYETEKAEQQTKMAEIQAAYDLNKKDAAIAILNKDNQIKDSQRNFLIAIAASLFVMTLLILYFFRQKQKSNHLLTEKNFTIEKSLAERETLLKEIHHRVKNNLQIISSLLSLQSKNTSDVAAQGAISESRNRVKSMSLIHEQLYREDTISGVDMKDYITRLVSSLSSSYGLNNEQVEVKIEAEHLLLDVDSAIPLGLIVNELVTNSMKYAFPEGKKGVILISLKEHMEELQLLVKDNGIGMDVNSKNSQSFGLSLVNSLMRKLKAEMNISSDKGTTVELKIRDFKKVSMPVLS